MTGNHQAVQPVRNTQACLHPNSEVIEALRASPARGEVVMLNLLRFRTHADYAHTPSLAPGEPISGQAAYRKYMARTGAILARRGGEVVFLGEGGAFLIGPEQEQWDLAMLVRYPSREAFLAFIEDGEYQAVLGHRTAALADSRLLPMNPRALK